MPQPARIPGEPFWRDASGRLTFDLFNVEAADFPAICHAVAEAFHLAADDPFVAGPDQMFWDFRRDGLVIGIDWDIWMGFMVVAKTEASETLVREIAAWLDSSQWSQK